MQIYRINISRADDHNMIDIQCIQWNFDFNSQKSLWDLSILKSLPIQDSLNDLLGLILSERRTTTASATALIR
ncbi:hypothetical protein BGS_0793 [Beggiatoa sp. SS]|nr:hypothetical protein BGS_0793 [Beggiatoa sp. SS]